MCRELTKKFEEVRRGSLAELADYLKDNPPRGEVVLVVDRRAEVEGSVDLNRSLQAAMARQSVKDAVAEVSASLGLPRRDVYKAALELGKKS